jgi:hypothetical protein
MRVCKLLLVAVWLTACCAVSVAQNKNDNTPDSAQKTFVEALRTDPSSIYFYLKRSFAADDAKERQRLKSVGVDDQYEGYGRSVKGNAIGIAPCEGVVVRRRFDAMGSRRLEDLADHADLVLFIRGALSEYPPSVWKDRLVAYEEQQLQRVASGKRLSGKADEQVRRELARAAREYRRTNPALPMIDPESQECGGASEARLRVEILPEGQFKRIQYANVRAYGFCEQANADGAARDACTGWNDATGTQKLVGNYKVRITWGDGSKQEFNLAVDRLEAESDGVRRPRYKRSN